MQEQNLIKQLNYLEKNDHHSLTFTRVKENTVKVEHKGFLVGYIGIHTKRNILIFYHPNIEKFRKTESVGVIAELFEHENLNFEIMVFRCEGKRYKTTKEVFLKKRIEESWDFGKKYNLRLKDMECLDKNDTPQMNLI